MLSLDLILACESMRSLGLLFNPCPLALPGTRRVETAAIDTSGIAPVRWDGTLVGYVYAVYRALARALGA